ncbi:MAG: hypothetical protein NUV54_00190 [Candidatus Taylorbacteria bacterium]|nr:hypothetical protein [Candidatus Taylorbacteria bacterium]
MNNLLPVILLLSSIGLFFGYINPAYTGDTGSVDTAGKSIKELKLEDADYTDALTKTAEIERVRSGLSEKLNSISPSNLEKIEKFLPDHIDAVRLIIDINNLAQKYGMSLTNLVLTASGEVPTTKKVVTPGAPIGPDTRPYSSIKLGYTVTGTYDNFVQFLKELEESLRVVDIMSLSFSTDKSKIPLLGQGPDLSPVNASDAFTYTMTIRTYFLK